jgi:hypothetical protein
VCKPKDKGGLGIVNLAKFALALCMRWLWKERKAESKPWVGLGNPCSPHEHELFGAATYVTVGNGKKTLLWEAVWLDGLCSKDVAPLIFKLSKINKIMVCKALEGDFWVSQINIQEGQSVDHVHQFYNLWEMLANVQLNNEAPDSIVWKLNNNGCYSAKSGSSPPPCLPWCGSIGHLQRDKLLRG